MKFSCYWVLICMVGNPFLYAITQEEANEELLKAAKGLHKNGIIYSLCEGADKRNLSPQAHLKMRQASDPMGRKGIELVRECELAYTRYPEYISVWLDRIDVNSPHNYKYYYPELIFRVGIINGINYHHDAALHRAIRLGEKGDRLVRHILGARRWFGKETEGVNIQNDHGDTPLHLIMRTSRSCESMRRMCLLLVSRGADAGICNNDGISPMMIDPHFWLHLVSSSEKVSWMWYLRQFFARLKEYKHIFN